MVNFGPLAAEIGPVVWGNPANFNGFRVLEALLHGTDSSSGCQPNFAALNRGRHLYSAGRPSRWASAHILVYICIRITDRCIDMVVRTVFRLSCSEDRAYIGSCVGLHPIAELVQRRTVKFMSNVVENQFSSEVVQLTF